MIFVLLVFATNTVFLAASVQSTVRAYVDGRYFSNGVDYDDFLGGPYSFLVTETPNYLNVICNACAVVSAFLSDSLLVSCGGLST